MTHQGERLRKYFNSHGISYASAARELGINKNTIHSWMAKELLPSGNIVRVGSKYSDVKMLFPEVDWEITSVGQELTVDRMNHLSDDAKQRIYDWQNRYLRLMTKYNELLEKHTEYLERMMGK
jgi:transcriptional regulator with XRE-family HTH domain